MNMLKKTLTTSFILITTLCCNNQDKTNNKAIFKTENTLQSISHFTGDYVSESYSKRSEGYDWMAVSVNQLSDSSVHIMVRSRIDKKNHLAPLMLMQLNYLTINSSLMLMEKELFTHLIKTPSILLLTKVKTRIYCNIIVLEEEALAGIIRRLLNL